MKCAVVYLKHLFLTRKAVLILPAKKTFQDDQVIEKIMHLFWQQGYYHTSMDEIVTVSGVKKQSLYNAIGDKHTLPGALRAGLPTNLNVKPKQCNA